MSKEPANETTRTAWWREAKIGMFIHWGPYAALQGDSRGTGITFPAEWSRHALRITDAEYHALAENWSPDRFDADAIASLASEAGMGYMVFTAKHHDGFCMFDSALTDFKITRSRLGRDVLGELAAACGKHGVRFGAYYSPRDWDHPDYPSHYDHADKPGPRYGGWWGTKVTTEGGEAAVRNLHGGPETVVENATFLDCGCFGCKADLPIVDQRDPATFDLPAYLEYEEGQIRELLTKYGDVSILWFDGQDHSPEEAGTDKLLSVIRKLNPDTLVNDRIGSKGYQADFGVAESHIPETGEARAWEACMTMPFISWGYDPNAHSFYTVAEIVHQVVDVVSKGGNMLINISPDELGQVPDYQKDRLRCLGRWLRRFGEAIYGAERSPLAPQKNVRFTSKDQTLYIIQIVNPGADIRISGLSLNGDAVIELIGSGLQARWDYDKAGNLHIRVAEIPVCHWAGEPALAFKIHGHFTAKQAPETAGNK